MVPTGVPMTLPISTYCKHLMWIQSHDGVGIIFVMRDFLQDLKSVSSKRNNVVGLNGV